MSDTLIEHPTSRLRAALAHCVAKPDMKGFLAGVDIAREFNLPLHDVRSTWDRTRETILNEQPVEYFWQWLVTAELRPRYRWPSPPTGAGDPEFDTCLGNFDPFGYVSAETTGRITDFPLHAENEPYGGFVPAMDFADLLPTWFRQRNPGEVISQHIRTFYPQAEDISDCSEQPKGATGGVLEIVARAAQSLGDNAATTDPKAAQLLHIAAKCLTKQASEPISTVLEDAVSMAQSALCAPAPARNGLVELGVLEAVSDTTAIPMLELVAKALARDAEVDTLHANDSDTIPAQDAEGTCARLPWALVPRVIWCLCNAISTLRPNRDAEEAKVIDLAVRRCLLAWRRVSDYRNFGQSPISRVNTARLFWSLLQISDANPAADKFWWTHWALMGAIDYDERAMLVPAGLMPYADPMCIQSYESGTSVILDRDELFDRSERYSIVIGKSFEHGNYDLGCALLAFTICTQANMGYSGLGWRRSQLVEFLQTASKYPGNDMVRDAVATALAILEHRGTCPDSLFLGSITTTHPASSPPLTRPYGLTRKEIEDEVIRGLGRECWLRIDNETKCLLVDAHHGSSRFRATTPDALSNWGNLAAGYLKAIEHELLKRYKPVLKSLAYKQYCEAKQHHAGKPTFGTVTYLVFNHSKLPAPLQRRIETERLAYHSSPDLVRLLKESRTLRNAAAHPSNFPAQKMTRTLEIVFVEKIFACMCHANDATPPCT